jgi:hypothetical protein
MSREILGNFELMVMLALIRSGDAAYGVSITKTIEERRPWPHLEGDARSSRSPWGFDTTYSG